MKVGFFDSGIGGLSVLHHAMKQMPDTEFIYYADTDHVPYGEKTIEEVRGFVEEIIEFLIGKGVDAVVIACNTATTVATKEFREKFPIPIVGMEPAVKKAVEEFQDTDKRVMVIATPITIAGEKLRNLVKRVDQDGRVDLLALPKLVRFAEEGDFTSPEIMEYLKEEMSVYPLEKYIALVPGCTHFNYFKKQYCKIFPGFVHFVDGNEGTVKQLMRVLPEKDEKVEQKIEYYFSGRPASEEELERIGKCLKLLDEMYEI